MTYDSETALVVVDVQNDFAAANGSLYVEGGEGVIPFINEQVRAAVEAGAMVVFTQDWHPPSTPHFAKDGGTWPVHCVGNTVGAEFHPLLDRVKGATIIRKGVNREDGYSAFSLRDTSAATSSETGLADQLRDRGVTRVVVVGLALDYCVQATARDAVERGFAALLLADGTRAVNLRPGDGSRAVVVLLSAGVEIR